MERSIHPFVSALLLALALAACGEETAPAAVPDPTPKVDEPEEIVPLHLDIKVLGVKPTSGVIVFEVNKPGVEIIVTFERYPSPVVFRMDDRRIRTWAYDGFTPDTTDVLTAFAFDQDGQTDEEWMEITTPPTPVVAEMPLEVTSIKVTPLTSTTVNITFKVNKTVNIELYSAEEGNDYFRHADVMRRPDGSNQVGDTYTVNTFVFEKDNRFRLYVFTSDGEVLRFDNLVFTPHPKEISARVNEVTSTTLDITWTSALLGTYYDRVSAECYLQGGSGVWRFDNRNSVNSGRFVLDNLIPGQKYNCFVRGYLPGTEFRVEAEMFYVDMLSE